jgi:diaminohydroxyphosphoribosylaminopyrimidine deaminase/5-amino-6-(5-phosphoribosylamino)uracil reductase
MHNFLMNKAIDLALKGQYTARPNPMVGCVLVQAGGAPDAATIIGEGYHAYCGGPHAEIMALNQAKAAGFSTTGATAYITLAPCCHTGKTPPCVDALIEAKISEVVYAIDDPNPVSLPNQAEVLLKKAGIKVTKGVLAEKAFQINKGFILRMQKNRPYVRAKVALSLDGNMALHNHKSQWITGEAARAHSQHYRAISGAIITGMGTMIYDQPRLTVREKKYLDLDKFVQPIAVVIDSKKSDRGVNLENKLFFQEDIATVLAILAKEYEINNVLLESGPGLFNKFLSQNLIDELIIYLAPKLLGKGAMNLSQFGPIEALTQSKDWVFQTVEQVGTDIEITAIPK